MNLTVQLPTKSNALGRLTRAWSSWWLAPRPISAALTRELDRGYREDATTHGVRDWRAPCNDVPTGRYELREIVTVPDAAALLTEFGRAYLLFEPLSGAAATAEAHGRLVLALHAGVAGGDGQLRGTTGHLRVSDATLEELLTLIEDATEPIYLEVEREDRAGPAPLSKTPAAEIPLPEGDARRYVPRLSDTDPSERRDDEDSWSRDDARRSSSEPWRPGGGQFAGGGNSGSWDDLVASRPVAVTAAGATAAAVIATAAAADSAPSGDSATAAAAATTTTGSGTAY